MTDDRVRLIIDGDADGAVRAARQAKTAVDGLGTTTRNASRHASAFAAAQREQARTLTQMGHAAKRASIGLTGLAVGGLAHAIKTGASFEQQMARVDAVTGANAKQMKTLTDVALDLGAKTKYSAVQAAEAMYEMAAAGFKVGETTKALPGVLALAASSNIELKDAAEISSNALRGFKLDASESGHVADVMASAVNRSSLELRDLQYSMKYVGPIAATTGQSLEQMTAAMSLMGNAGIKGEQAGTTLRGALVRLTKPTKMVNEGLRTLNLDIKDLQGPKGLKPLSEIIRLVEQRTDGMGKATRNTALAQIFGTEALSGMVAVIDQGSGKLTTLTRAYESSDGAAIRSANTMNATVAGAFENLKGSIETVETKLFLKFRKPLREALLDAAGMVNREGKEIEQFFDRVTGTQEFKAADLGGRIRIMLREIGKAVDEGEISEQIGDALALALEKAAPAIAKAAAEVGMRATEAFAKAFIETSPLGRLVLATWLLKKTGGLAAFRAMGATSGGAFATGFGATAAAGTAAGGFKGAMIANLKQVGVAGAVAAAIAFGPELVKSMKRSLSTTSPDFGLEKHARIRPLGLDLNPLEGLTDSLTSGRDKLRDFGDTFDQTFAKLQKAGDSRGLAALADQARRMGDQFEDQQPKMERLADTIEQGLRRQAIPAFEAMRRAGGKNMRAIVQQVNDSGFEIRQTLGHDTQAGKDALARNFELAAQAVRKSMKDGEISTKTGLALIREYMGQALAQYGFSKKEAANIIAGKEFSGKSAPGGKSKTNAAHGFIGRAGAAGRDMVPLMVGEGEAVLNRHQQQVVDGALAAQGIGGLPDLFSKVTTPHYMASGGIAGTPKIRRVKVRGDLGTVSKVSQGAVDRVRGAAQDRLDQMAPSGAAPSGGPLPKGLSGGTSGANQALGRRMMLAAGFGPDQWPALKALWIGESGWSNTARNRSSGAFGIPQALPPTKMPLAAQRGDARAQIQWGLDYIRGRYGSPSAAYRFWQSQSPHWYARGGFARAAKGHLPPWQKRGFARGAIRAATKGRRFKHHLPLKTLANIDSLGGQVEDANTNFGLVTRRHDLTTEQPLMTVVDPATGEPVEVRDEGAIGTHVGELGEQRSLKIDIANLIARQQGEAKRALALLAAGMAERREALKALRERIKLNVQHIKEWQAAIKRKREEIRNLRRQLQDTGTKKGTAGRRKALRGQIRGLEDDITDLTAKITGAGDSNQRLGGQVSTKEGELRTWTDHHDRAGQLDHDLPYDLSGVRLDIADLEGQIQSWSGTKPPAAQIQTPDAAAAGASDTSSQLLALQAQQLDELRKSAALSRAQLGVFRDFAPLAAMRFQGAFLHGGRIRETGIARVHRDEYVVPDPEGPMGNQLTSPRTASAQPVQVQLVLQGDAGQLVRLIDARVDGRAANVVSQQLGRRSRLITSAAGGR